MRPRGVLLIAGSCLLAVFAVAVVERGWDGATQSFFANAAFRVGLVTLAVAFAWPQLIPIWRRFPPWFWLAAILLGLMLLVLHPRAILLVLALLLILLVIQTSVRWLSARFFRRR